MNKKHAAILAGGFLFVAGSAQAVDCTGQVTVIGYDTDWANPALTISLSNGPQDVRICGLNGDYNNVAAATCKLIYSELLTAKVTKRTVTFSFPNYTDCNSIPAWQAAAIGWYTFN